MVRLSADLISRTPVTINYLNDRELSLRGHKIPAIENLGATRDTLDALDLTDNAVSALANFPLLRRLQHLHLANNPVRTVSASVPTSLPNLRTLVLTNAAFPPDSLPALGDVLGRCRKLDTLVLKGSDVTHAPHYREWLVFNCKKLRSLDFDRIKDKDRALAKSLFQTPQGTPTPLAASFTNAAAAAASASHTLAKTFEPGVTVDAEPGAATATAAAAGGKAGRLLSKEEKDRVRAAIEAAESVEEIRRLQRMLAQGFVPTEKDLKDLARKKKGPRTDAMEQD